MLSNSTVLDTRFRVALDRMAAGGRLEVYTAPIDPKLEVAGALKKRDGGPAMLFTDVQGHDVPVVGNLLCCQANCEAAFGVGFADIRNAVGRGIAAPLPPVVVDKAVAQQHVHTNGFDIGALLPVLFHTAEDAGRFVTAGVVIVRDPETGVYNASYHRLQLLGPNRTAVKLDYGRHLRAAFERAQRMNVPLPVVVCIGADLALQYTAATMGSQMPEHADELAAAGGFCGRALPVAKAITQDLLVPADTEIVLEGRMLPDQTVREGRSASLSAIWRRPTRPRCSRSRRSRTARRRSTTPSTATAARPSCCASTCWRRACSRCCRRRCRSWSTPR